MGVEETCGIQVSGSGSVLDIGRAGFDVVEFVPAPDVGTLGPRS